MKVPQADLANTAVFYLTKIGGLPESVREHQFDPDRRWRFDLAWPEYLVAVEIHGEGHYDKEKKKWIQGRHHRTPGFRGDCEKLRAAQLAGWMVLPFTGSELKDTNEFIATVKAALERRGWKP